MDDTIARHGASWLLPSFPQCVTSSQSQCWDRTGRKARRCAVPLLRLFFVCWQKFTEPRRNHARRQRGARDGDGKSRDGWSPSPMDDEAWIEAVKSSREVP
ncbi:uncharacterized protein LOC144087356 isoform X1 [Stigmatopora argus]